MYNFKLYVEGNSIGNENLERDGDINVITHVKLKIILHIYAILYIILLRDNFSIYVIFFLWVKNNI